MNAAGIFHMIFGITLLQACLISACVSAVVWPTLRHKAFKKPVTVLYVLKWFAIGALPYFGGIYTFFGVCGLLGHCLMTGSAKLYEAFTKKFPSITKILDYKIFE